MSVTYNTRIKNKRDTAANWERENPVLLNGEIILVDTAAGDLRQKIGDGVKTYTQLPFTDEVLNTALNNKYNKTGGEVSGNVKIDGTLTLDIDDPDYDSGITFSKSLDTNNGTILTLTGYADNTSYRPVIRNIHDPVNNYDAATKKYVDEQVVHPSSYLVALNNDGTIADKTSSLTYSKVKSELTDYKTDVYLDVIYGTSRLHIPASQDMDTNNGPIVFAGPIRMLDGNITEAVFLLDTSNELTPYYTTRENALYKTSDLATNYNSELAYPTVKGVWNTFQRKPVVIWEVDGINVTAGLNAIQADISENPSWQLTGLDMTPFKRIKIYSKGGQGQTNAGTTGAMILEMSLDPRMAITTKGGHYVGSVMSQKPNDANRYASLTCAVSADKTSFVVLRQTSLYGTAATTNNDIGASVVLIEGYYD